MDNDSPKKKSNCFYYFVIIILVICICAVCAGGSYFFLPDDIIDDIVSTSSDEEYLGYEVVAVDIQNFEDMNDTMFAFYDGLSELVQIEDDLYKAALAQNADNCFDNYKAFNVKAGELMGQAEGMTEFMEDPTNDLTAYSLPFISEVSAKKRTSMWYWIPIIGNMVKAKHAAIETSRAGIYNYLKNDLEEVDRQDFLDYYKLDSVEDIRNGSDTLIEKLGRDSELRNSIDWTKVTTEFGKAAVKSTVEGLQAGTSGSIPNPIKDTVKNAIIDMQDGKIDTVGEDIPSVMASVEQADKVLIGVSKETQDMIDLILNSDVGSNWDQIDDNIKDKLSEKIEEALTTSKLVVIHKPSITENKNMIQLPQGEWDIVATTKDTVPVEISAAEAFSNKVTKIIKATIAMNDIKDLPSSEIATLPQDLAENSVVTPTGDTPDDYEGHPGLYDEIKIYMPHYD